MILVSAEMFEEMSDGNRISMLKLVRSILVGTMVERRSAGPSGAHHRGRRKVASLPVLAALAIPALFAIAYTTFTSDLTMVSLDQLKDSFASYHSSQAEVSLTVPASLARKADDYWCTAAPLIGGRQTLTAFVPKAKETIVHHMVVAVCDGRPKPKNAIRVANSDGTKSWVWPCGLEDHNGICPGRQMTLVYAWSKNAGRFETGFPRQGFVAGKREGLGAEDVALQGHLLRQPTEEEKDRGESAAISIETDPRMPQSLLSLSLFLNANFKLPPGLPRVRVRSRCCVRGSDTIEVFAYRVHAHGLGRNITLAAERGGGGHDVLSPVLSGDPRLPHYFTKTSDLPLPYQPSRFVLPTDAEWEATCEYDTTSAKRAMLPGEVHGDEMCNLYLLLRSHVPRHAGCYSGFYDAGVFRLKRAYKMGGVDDSSSEGVLEATEEGGRPGALLGPLASALDRLGFGAKPRAQPNAVFFDESMGQVGGIHLGFGGNPNHALVFHRALRTMSSEDHNEAIGKDVFQVWNVKEKRILGSFGSDLPFKLPHGLTIDRESNVWLTDVDTQLLYKLDPTATKVLLTAGVEGERAGGANVHDPRYLCRPTEIAVSNDGDVFLADGYCNSRVVRYDAAGTFVRDFQLHRGGRSANVPHSIVLDGCSDTLIVADRENALLRFMDASGEGEGEVRAPVDLKTFGKVYSVTRDEYGNVYALCWLRDVPAGNRKTYLVQVQARDTNYRSGGLDLLGVELAGCLFPHDFAVTYNFEENALDVYVGETGTKRDARRGRVVRYRIVL